MSPDPADEGPVLFLYRLKPGAGPEYERIHRQVWPEILALLDEAGLHDYRIWRHGDIVVSSVRARGGIGRALRIEAASEVQARWSASMAHLFEAVADGNGEPLWLHEIFTHRPWPEGRG